MQTSDAAENQNYVSVERLGNTLAKNVEEVHGLKVRVQELGFEAGRDDGKILFWRTDLQTKLGVFG